MFISGNHRRLEFSGILVDGQSDKFVISVALVAYCRTQEVRRIRHGHNEDGGVG